MDQHLVNLKKADPELAGKNARKKKERKCMHAHTHTIFCFNTLPIPRQIPERYKVIYIGICISIIYLPQISLLG